MCNVTRCPLANQACEDLHEQRTTGGRSRSRHDETERTGLFPGGNVGNVKCRNCGGGDFWQSAHTEDMICRVCHPPAPGAEKK